MMQIVKLTLMPARNMCGKDQNGGIKYGARRGLINLFSRRPLILEESLCDIKYSAHNNEEILLFKYF